MRTAVAPQRWLVLAILASGAFGSTGCTLLGLGLGAAVPRWKSAPAGEVGVYADEGDDVDVQLRAGSVSGSYSGMIAKGSSPNSTAIYVSNPGTVVVPGQWPALVLITDKGERRIQLPDAQRVDVRKGSHWDVGLGVGVALDVIVAMTVGILVLGVGGHIGYR